MALPKIETPIFKLKLPSSGMEVSYRSFLVKEEKLLLYAKESNDMKDTIEVFKNIVNNCVLTDIDVNTMPLFDIEYCFLMIRSKSQNPITHFKITDDEDKQEYDAGIDFSKIKIVHNENHKNTIDLDGNIGLKMRYPSLSDLEELNMFDQKENNDKIYDLINRCIESVFDADSVYPMSEASDAEKNEFFESLTSEHMVKIQEFFMTFPTVVGTIDYIKNGKKVSKEVKGAQNFLV